MRSPADKNAENLDRKVEIYTTVAVAGRAFSRQWGYGDWLSPPELDGGPAMVGPELWVRIFEVFRNEGC